MIPLSRPDLTQAEIDAVLSVLQSDRLSLGPHLEAFEQAVAKRANRKYGIGVNSGTSGLHLCIRSLGIKEGDEVITTPFSFIATTNCILFERATPVFVDIDPDSYNMDPKAIEAAITHRTKAILPAEAFGNTAHFDEYERIAKKHNLLLIEDSCEALGGSLDGRPAGNFGQCSVFAFYPNKQVTAGEGGVIVTDDLDIRNKCTAMRNQGRIDSASYVHSMLGYNYRLNEISAAIGEVQMSRLDDILSKRRDVAASYAEALSGISEITRPPMTEPNSASWFVFVIRLSDEFSPGSRELILDSLKNKGVQCQKYFYPIHLQPYIQERFSFRKGQFPNCERISDQTIALPFFSQMTPAQTIEVANALKEAIAEVKGVFQGAKFATDIKPDPLSVEHKVPFFRVKCNGNELSYVREVLESGWLTTAQKASKLETDFANLVEADYGIAVNSCTAALHLALEAIGVKPGEQVFVPTMTFTATAEVIRYLHADPVMLDVEYGSSLITPQILEDAIKKHPNIKKLVLVHFAGQPCQMYSENGKGIVDICKRNGIRIVEDAAHAFPAKIGGKMIGSIGDVTCFSFYANKTMTAGEGGMLTTNDPEIAKRAATMRLHGIDRDVWDRFTSTKASWEYDIVAPGFKYNMSDINAAVGLAQLEQSTNLHKLRLEYVKYYYEHLKGIPHIDLPICHVPLEDHSWHLFIPILKDTAPLSRNELIDVLADRGIGTSVHYKPLHRMTYYKEHYNLDRSNYPNAERIWQGCVSLPLFPTMTEYDLEYICANLIDLLS